MLKLILRNLPPRLFNLLVPLITLLLLPIVARRYFRTSTGRAYGVGLATKLRLLAAMVRNNMLVPSASIWVTHLLMATEILNVPPSVKGVIVECGCFKGGSTVNLSLVAAACGRELHVFDSFAGLPDPSPEDSGHLLLVDSEVQTYARGAYAGTLQEVTSNIERFGARDACTFHKGYFEDTLPQFDQPIVFAFVDVDLASSVKTCLEYLWPLLIDGGYLFTDEAPHLEIAGLFYDRQWWSEVLGTEPPGLVGAGNGLGLFPHEGGFFGSSIGYTAKIDRSALPSRPG
ncbi:TylF/MycF/NovP-related O-methyltransferase [uncultured Mycobacterium sp.]|uniref:TylF/MycF/NovP-related O-methyltransferase n=1 Tax=uncultured Mycobacterium sp. TaxID=171292 RepID=UPI0035CA3F39